MNKTKMAHSIAIQLLALGTLVFVAGCATQRTVPPLFTSPPQKDVPREPRLLQVPTPPASKPLSIVINIPQKKTVVAAENSVMRKGATIKGGSSVVISVPGSMYQRSQDTSARATTDALGFRTDGYFNVLEQYIERGLLAVGLQAKDRAKFEAKLRDVRDSGAAIKGADNSYAIALASLQRDLDAGKMTRDEFVEKTKQLRDKLLDPSAGSRNREELTDISELIRAAQDGDVMADFILQVNDLAVTPYSGTPLQLAVRPEVQAAVSSNPGLRIGGEEGRSIPATLPQPWAQARFNAKLIDAKTGSIDWIGEYSIESLAVLDGGITITIGARRHTANGKAVVDAVSAYNRNVSDAYQRAIASKAELERTYQEVMQPIRYEGPAEQGQQIQNRRRYQVEQVESSYQRALSALQDAIRREPSEARAEWLYTYDVDTAVVSPDLLNPRNEDEQRRLLEHVKALGFKVTHDLLSTMKVGEE